MISYDIYKNRIKRIAAVKNFIVRFRILFLALLAVILALISAFLATKGIVTDEFVLPQEIVYGDRYTVQKPKALFSSARIEYAYLGAETPRSGARPLAKASDNGYVWTTEQPTRAGRYLARTVTDRAFGRGYGKSVEFEIKPLETQFTIDSKSVIYGSDPDSYTFPLVNGDRLIAEGLVFDYDGFETELTYVCANAQSFRIVNEKGEDVTSCYVISTPKTEILLKNKQLTIAPEAPEFVYDGKPVQYAGGVDATTQLSLGKDVAHISTVIRDGAGNLLDGLPVTVGTYTVEIDAERTRIFNGETDVTARYDLSYRSAAFTVARRPLAIVTDSAVKEYDGAPLSAAGFTQEGLAEGHTLRASGALPAVRDAERILNEYSFRVFDENGNDVTENYAIDYTYGSLEVTKRVIGISTADAEKVYNGRPLSKADGYSVYKDGGTALVAGHEIGVRGATEIVDVAQSGAENILSFVFYDENGADVTDNYAPQCEWGVLTIRKRKITVTTGSHEWTYDGRAHVWAELKGDNLAAGESFVIDSAEEITDAGNKPNRIFPEIASSRGNTTANYEFTYRFGTLTVKPRSIRIYAPDCELVYNGKAQNTDAVAPDVYFVGSAGWGLVDGHAARAVTHTERTVVGSVVNVCEYEIYDPARPDADVNRNYIIKETVAGSLTILPRPVTVRTATAEKVYDGAPFTATEDWRAEGEFGLADGHTLAVESGTRPSSVTAVTEGAVENVVSYRVVCGGEDVTVNYELTYQYGRISRTRRPLTITTQTASTVYDGDPMSNTGISVAAGLDQGPVSGHSTELDTDRVAFVTYVTEGEVDNVLYHSVKDANGRDVTENYAIAYVYGKLSRTPRPLTVTTATLEKVYDGTLLYGASVPDGVVITGTPARFSGLVKDDFAVVDVNRPMENVVYDESGGVTGIENDCVYKVGFANGQPATDNYRLIYEYGTLTILPRPITVRTASIEREYDGNVLSDATPEVASGSLVHNDRLTAYGNIPSLRDVGEARNEIRYCVEYDLDGPLGDYLTGDNTYNYEITYDYGTLKMIPRPITVETESGEWVYDGEEHTKITACDIWYQASPDAPLEPGPVSADQRILKAGPTTKIRDVGSVENVFEIRIAEPVPDDEAEFFVSGDTPGSVIGVRDISKNYVVVKYVYGTLTVTPRPITVFTATASREYNARPFTATEGWRTAYRFGEGETPDERFGLVSRHTLEVEAGTQPSSVMTVYQGEVENVVSYRVKEGGTDVTRNYEIKYEYGKISVTPRRILITTATESRVYSGKAWSNDKFTAKHIASDGAEPWYASASHGFITDSLTEITFVGSVPNICSYSFYDSNGAPLRANYEPVYEYGTLTVTARPITVYTSTFEKVYDREPLFGNVSPVTGLDEAYAVNLAEGDTILAIENTVASAWEVMRVVEDGVSRVVGVPNRTQYAVYGGGKDRSENYTIAYEYGTLTITPRPLEITNPTLEKEYDGSPLYGVSSEETIAKGLVADDALFVSSIAEITDVGEIENDTEYRIFGFAGTYETTGNYTISYARGAKLKVTPRPIEIETGSQSWVYDGRDHSCFTDFVVRYYLTETLTEPGFVSDAHQILIRERATIRKVGSIPNAYSVLMGVKMDWPFESDPDFYEGGVAYRDVSKNYSVAWKLGTLTVTARPITVSVLDQTKMYDGTPLPNKPVYITYDMGNDAGLVTGENHIVDDVTTDGSQQTDVGSCYLMPTAVRICVLDYTTGETIEDVTDNYAITYVAGKLTVTQRPITISAVGQQKVYDGAPLPVDPEIRLTSKYGSALVKGHRAVDYVFAGTQTAIGESPLSVSGARIVETDASGAEVRDVSFNYDISYEDGTLSVTARPITVTTADAEKTYDGTPLTKTDGYVWQTFDGENHAGLVGGHRVEADLKAPVASVTYVSDNAPENNALSFRIYEGETDVTANYAITVKKGTLSILKRKAQITTATLEKEYDGTPLSGDSVPEGPVSGTNAAFAGFVAGETFMADASVMTDVLRADNGNPASKDNLTSYRVLKDGTDSKRETTENYEIVYHYGTLKITPRAMTVKTSSVTRLYDGTVLEGTEGEWEFTGLVSDERIGLPYDVARIVDCGSVTNTTKYLVFGGRDGIPTDVTANYDITYEYGTLTIERRALTVTVATLEKIYDGKDLDGDAEPDGTVVTGTGARFAGLVDGETAKSDLPTRVREVFRIDGVVTALENRTQYRVYAVRDGNTVETTGNYDIAYEYGSLTVRPRPITVTTATLTKTYDGAPLRGKSRPDGEIVTGIAAAADSLVEDHAIFPIVNPDSYTQITEVFRSDGEVSGIENQTKYRIYSMYADDAEEIRDVTENYEIAYRYGTLTILPRPVTIATADAEQTYDGTPLSKTDGYRAQPFDGAAHAGIVDGHTASLREGAPIASVTHVRENRAGNNALVFAIFDGDREVTENYTVTVDCGTLTIKPREMRIVTASLQKAYDGSALRGDSTDEREITVPLVFLDAFVGGDFAEADSAETALLWNVSRKNGAVSGVPNDTRYKIYQTADGEKTEITDDYAIEYEYGTLTVLPREIVITTGTKLDREYDAQPFYYTDGASADDLVDGHALSPDMSRIRDFTIVTNVYERDGAGNLVRVVKDNHVFFRIVEQDSGLDVTDNYEVTDYVYGKIGLVPREISVATGSATHVYDGTAFSYTENIKADRLASSAHRLVADPEQPVASVTNVWENRENNNVFSVRVLNASGTDISYNYSIVQTAYGTIEILPLDVVIITPSAEKTYDGAPLSDGNFTVETLVGGLGHRLKATDKLQTITDVGTATNSCTFTIVQGEGEDERDVSANYKVVEYRFGTLEVKPRELALDLLPMPDLVYGDGWNGYPDSFGNFAYSAGSDRLVSGEKLKISVYFTSDPSGADRIAAPKNAGVYYLWLDGENCVVERGGKQSAASNYLLVQKNSARFEIARREIQVRLSEAGGKTYDGKPFFFDGKAFVFVSGGTAYGETLTVGVSYFDETRNAAVAFPIDAGDYGISLDPTACRIDGTVPAQDNYEIVCENDVSYRIAKKEFTVKLKNFEREYNGTVFDYALEVSEIETSELAEGDAFSGAVGAYRDGVGTEALFAGAYVLRLDGTGWQITGGRGDVSENYVLTLAQDGALTIAKRAITVEVWFAETDSAKLVREYCGEPIRVPQRSYRSSKADGETGFVNGDDYGAIPQYAYMPESPEGAPSEVGAYLVAVGFGGNALIRENYEISYRGGEFEIIMRYVTVRAAALEGYEYDGTALGENTLTLEHYHTTAPDEIGFLNGDEAWFTPTFEIYDLTTNQKYHPASVLQAGEYRVVVSLNPETAFGYVITKEEMRFTVEKRLINTKTKDFETVYSKRTVLLTNEHYTASYAKEGGAEGFVGNDAARAVPVYEYHLDKRVVTPCDAGEYLSHAVAFTSTDGFIDRNYEVDIFQPGRLTISPRALVVFPKSYSEPLRYAGQELRLPETSYTLAEGYELPAGDSLAVTGDTVLDSLAGRFTEVRIQEAIAYDVSTKRNVTTNYRISFRYDENDPEVSGKFKETKFQARLSFTKRKITVAQNVLPEELRRIQYDGNSVDIPIVNGGIDLFTYVTDIPEGVAPEEYGLLTGHSLVVAVANTGNTPGVVKKWLKRMEVYDADGNNVSELYTVTITAEEESYLYLAEISVTVTVHGLPADYADGTVLSAADYAAEAGKLLYGHEIEVVVEGGRFVVSIFESYETINGEIKRRDKNKYYTVTVITED